jgi:hypothetical protein
MKATLEGGRPICKPWRSFAVLSVNGRVLIDFSGTAPGDVITCKLRKKGQDLHMSNAIATGASASIDSLLRDCAATLQRVAAYRLPPALDRRLLWLSENKEALNETEREELLALVEFAEERTVDKLHARATLQRFTELWPHLLPAQS